MKGSLGWISDHDAVHGMSFAIICRPPTKHTNVPLVVRNDPMTAIPSHHQAIARPDMHDARRAYRLGGQPPHRRGSGCVEVFAQRTGEAVQAVTVLASGQQRILVRRYVLHLATHMVVPIQNGVWPSSASMSSAGTAASQTRHRPPPHPTRGPLAR